MQQHLPGVVVPVGVMERLERAGPEGPEEGVRLAGGGVVGWFRAALEAALMGVADGVGDICGRELDRARQMPPGRCVRSSRGFQ